MVTTKTLIQLASDLPSALRVAQARAHTTGNTWTTEQVERVWLARTHTAQVQATSKASKPRFIPMSVVGYVPRTVRVLVSKDGEPSYAAYVRVLRATVGKRGATTHYASMNGFEFTLTSGQVARLVEGNSVTAWMGTPARARKLVPAPLA
jgi:hypothetical protein